MLFTDGTTIRSPSNHKVHTPDQVRNTDGIQLHNDSITASIGKYNDPIYLRGVSEDYVVEPYIMDYVVFN